MQDKRENQEQATERNASAKPTELKSIPKSPVNDYQADVAQIADVKSSIATAKSNGSGTSMQSRRSIDMDQELIRKKLKAINSIKNRLQSQISNSSSAPNTESKRNTGQFGSQVNSNSDEKMNGSNQELSLGHIMKLTTEKQELKSQGGKQADQYANSGSFQGMSKGASDTKNPFTFKNAYSPLNSQNQNDGTTITMDGIFKRSGGTSYDAQNETHNFPGNRTSRLVHTNSTVPIPTSATQAADIETMSSDIQMAEAVDLAAQPTQRTDRLTITDLAIVSDPAHSDGTAQPLKPATTSHPGPQLSKQDSLDSKAPLSNLSHISHISPAQLTSNMFSATQFEMRGAQETVNRQFTVHDYNRHFQIPQRDRKGQTNRDRAGNVSRGKCNESPNLGDTKFHHTDGTNTEQLTDLQNPLENLTQTQENDEFGHMVKKISSVRGSVTRTDLVRNSATRTERNSNDRKRGEKNQGSTPRGSRESLLRNQMINNQGQGQGQGGYNPYRGGNSVKGNSVQNRVSQGGDHKPSNGTYSKISERSVSSLGQAFSNKESHQAEADNILNSHQNIRGTATKIRGISSESPENKLAKNKTFKYPNDANQTQETRNIAMGAINNNVFKTPSARNFESTGGPCLEDINVMDSWPQSQPKFNQKIKMTTEDHKQMLQIGGRDIGTIKKINDQRSSIEVQSVQTRDSQFIGQETCKNLFLNDALLSQGSYDQKWLNYQRKEDFTMPRSPKKPVPLVHHRASKSREKKDLIQTPKSKPHAPSTYTNPHHQVLHYPSKYTTQANYTATPVAKKSANMQFRPSPKYYAPDHPVPRQQRANTASVSPKKFYQVPQSQPVVGQQRQKKMITTNFQKKNPPSFKSGIKAMKKFNQRSKERTSHRSGSNDDHIRVQLLKDRDDLYRRMQTQSSASRSSASSGFYRPSIDTWSNESLDANKRHVWTYRNDNDNKFIQIFTPATELTKKRLVHPVNIHNPASSRTIPTMPSLIPPSPTHPLPPTSFGKPLPAFHLPLHLLPSPAISHRQTPAPALQPHGLHANSDLDVLTSAPPSSSSRMPQRLESARDGLGSKVLDQHAPLSSHPASSRSKNNLSQQNQQFQQQAAFSSNEMIDRIMAKNRQIIQEQKDILRNYQSNYERLYNKYKNLKEVKYRQLKIEKKQQQQRIDYLEDLVKEYKQQQQLKASDLKILTPGRQRSSSGSRSRDRSPLSLKLAVATGESRMSLQYKYDALNQKYQMLQEKLADQKTTAKNKNETSNFNDKQHNFERHNKLKVKLYDKINDLAWKYRSKLETGKEETANGRQLPVKDLWRWFKLMYRIWRQQHTVQPVLQTESEHKKAEEVEKEKDSVPKNQEAAKIPPRQSSSLSPRLTPRGSSSPSPYRDDSKKRQHETQSPCSQQDSKVSSIQKILCIKLNIDNAASYQEKKSQIIERVEELQKIADTPPCQGCDKQEQLTKLCKYLQIESGLDAIENYIESQEKLKQKKEDNDSMSELLKNDRPKHSRYPSISIVQASLDNLPVASEQNQGAVQPSSQSGDNNNMDDTITRAKLDNLESQLKEDLAFEQCWANANDQDSFLMNAPSNRHSKDSSRLLRDSQLGKQSIPELSLIKDAESKDEPNNTTERALLHPDQNPFQVSQRADVKERSGMPGAAGTDDSSRNSSQKRGSDCQPAARPSQDQPNEYSSVHLARISLESQIKEEEVEESREDVDSQGRAKNRASRIENLSSFIGQSAAGQGNLMDPRNSCPPSRSSFGSPTSRVASQLDEPNSSHLNLPTGTSELLDLRRAEAP